LSNGNVVVTNPNDNLGGTNAGAVYLFNGLTGALIGSLVGSHANDVVGNYSFSDSDGYHVGGLVRPLSNGNYLVISPSWNGLRGAVTWGSGNTGVSGTVSDANSLVGTNPNDGVGGYYVYDDDGKGHLFGYVVVGVSLLSNGNYVVGSPNW